MKKALLLSILVLALIPALGQADTVKPPILVVDKCPEFCPELEPPVEVCAQVLIPVPGQPGYWYTNSCKKTIIQYPSETKSDKESNGGSVDIPTPIEEPAKGVEEEPPLPLPETFVCSLGLATSMQSPHNLLFEVIPDVNNFFGEV
jgi:hypothetical protein